MLNIVWEDIKHYFNLSLAHCFNDVFLVMTKKEKTSTLSSTCSSTEYLFSIKFRWQTLFKQLHTKFVHIKQLCKLIKTVVSNLHLCIYNLACLFINLVLRTLEIRLSLTWLSKKVFTRCLAPFLCILDLYLSQDNSNVSILLHDILHFLEFLELVLGHSIFNKIKQGELADTL
jgi:hypothetical protein